MSDLIVLQFDSGQPSFKGSLMIQACDQQYHALKEVIDRAEIMMIQDLEGDAEHGLIIIDYNEKLQDLGRGWGE